jgi:hypothetical protein
VDNAANVFEVVVERVGRNGFQSVPNKRHIAVVISDEGKVETSGSGRGE